MAISASTRSVLAMLDELIILSTLDEGSPQSFKVRAYEKAKLSLEADGRDLTALSAKELTAVDGVGKATASKIVEFVETGSVEKLDRLRVLYPPEFVELSRIPGLGPKTLALVRGELGVENIEQLKEAIAAEKLRTLPGLGETSEAKISKSIERLGLSGKDRRTPIADAFPLAERLVEDLLGLTTVLDAKFCGSLRRMSETVGDIDITVSSNDPLAVMEAVRTHGEASDIILSGDTKTSFLTAAGLQVDVRVVAPAQFGAAILYFTGSKAHNIELRQRAIDRGLLLNEYGLLDTSDESLDPADRPVVASVTEQDVYEALDMAYVPPPMREGTGEVKAAAFDIDDTTLPEVVTRADILGDLHYHTDRSGDGRSSVEDMVEVGAQAGYQYLAITDHGVDLAINGSTAEEMLEHREHINEVAANYPDMTILWGCELNIGKDGGLDYDSDFRSLLDYTVASVHSHYDQDVVDQTDRLIAAIADPTVNSIGHLTGRYIGRRPGIELDIDVMIDALLEYDVALEINGALQRLDAASDVVRRAVEREVLLVINTDSHHVSELGRMEHGVHTAQRGWAPKDSVINTWDRDRFLAWCGHTTAGS